MHIAARSEKRFPRATFDFAVIKALTAVYILYARVAKSMSTILFDAKKPFAGDA